MKTLSGWLFAFSLSCIGNAHAQSTLDAVTKKGFVQCGVNAGALAGFSAPDSQGVWKGLDVDLCRA
ncbi:MAG: amino acid ABC transporter substrate-binding protein, partial [Betaproteobacteria bacterium]